MSAGSKNFDHPKGVKTNSLPFPGTYTRLSNSPQNCFNEKIFIFIVFSVVFYCRILLFTAWATGFVGGLSLSPSHFGHLHMG
jgi:hypothetical protein